MSSYRKDTPFLDHMRHTIRTRHYSIRTEHAYVGWVKRFIIFHKKRHPRDMAEAEFSTFLSWLAGGPEWGGG